MKAKYYFNGEDAENCYSLNYHKEWMRENNIPEMELFGAEMVTNSDYFYCSEFGEIGEVGEGCGKECPKYQPRNGKNGRCRFSNNVYEPGKSKIIKL